MSRWRNLFRKRRRPESIASLRAKIERFRSLLSSNNDVLEAMAEAGEAQGGEILFDSRYLEQLASNLAAAVRTVVTDLDQITEGRYPELLVAFERVRVRVAEALESRPMAPDGPDVMPLSELSRDLASASGEKMARLGEIRERLKCNVPDGFVITSAACARIFAAVDLAGHLQRMTAASAAPPEPGQIARELGELVRSADLPRDLTRAINKAVGRLGGGDGPATFALRSSALGEDGDLSFAGLHATFLGVTPAQVTNRYSEVLASLFAVGAVVYRLENHEPLESALMPVGCMRMVRARASGVLYTMDPADLRRDVLVVTAAPGLGKIVVEGGAEADQFAISRAPPHRVVHRNVQRKQAMYAIDRAGLVHRQPVPDELRDVAAVGDRFLATLAETALTIERYMKTAQDIEWAEDQDGRPVILQLRPLPLQTDTGTVSHQAQEAARRHQVLLSERGTIACRGIGCGQVVVVRGETLPTDLPAEFVLVAHLSSPHLAELVPRAQAVLTDVGASTGHLATITREFRVPTMVDLGNATEVLTDGMEVTVDAEENVVYLGRVDELLRYQVLRRSSFEDSREFRILRRMLRFIAPLHLDDPTSDRFTARRCRSYHDIIRFAHEKAVESFLEGRVDIGRNSPHSRKVEMSIPLDLVVIDLGGGLAVDRPGESCTRDQIVCPPLRALLDGLHAPGAWSTEPAGMDLESFMSSAIGPSVLAGPPAGAGRNLAIVSDRYLNLNLHLGYHFSQVDCYLSEVRNDNYIYFRFAGGLTDAARRERRAKAISIALERQDFVVQSRGDFVVARLKKFEHKVLLERMRMLGLLIGFTRQLDVRMRGDSMIGRSVDEFMEALYFLNQH